MSLNVKVKHGITNTTLLFQVYNEIGLLNWGTDVPRTQKEEEDDMPFT